MQRRFFISDRFVTWPQFVRTPISESRYVWKNGKIIPWAEATVHVSSHGLHYGTGVFEGIRCYDTPSGPAVFRLTTHIERWFLSAQSYGITWPYSRHDLTQAVLHVIRMNAFRECYVRPIAFYGSRTLALDPKGCPVEVTILAWPFQTKPAQEDLGMGVDACISTWGKPSPRAFPPRAKACGQHLNSFLAVRDAVSRGFAESILLDDAGNLTEASGQNLFLVVNKVLFTNDYESGVLLGVTRDTILHLATDLGLGVYTQKLTPNHLRTADEAFLSSTEAEIIPLATVDMNPIGKGTRGPTTILLQEAFRKAVSGRNSRYRDWLTYVAPH
jgi:branched-chain amino acid aminotransferase